MLVLVNQHFLKKHLWFQKYSTFN